MTALSSFVLGYLDDWSVCRGSELTCYVSTNAPQIDADIIALTGWRRPRPDHPSIKGGALKRFEGKHQLTAFGSFGVADMTNMTGLSAATLSFWVKPTHGPSSGDEGVVALCSDNGASCISLVRRSLDGATRLVAVDSESSPVDLPTDVWSHVVMELDTAGAVVTIMRDGAAASSARLVAALSITDVASLCLGAGALHRLEGRSIPWRADKCFSGRIGSVEVFEGRLEAGVLHTLPTETSVAPASLKRILALSPGTSARSDQADDMSGLGSNLKLFNGAIRGVPGRLWDGTYQRRSDGPAHYDAIHFNPDSLDNANWDPSIVLPLPDTLESGVYAVRLKTPDGIEDIVPFFVVPQPDQQRARTALVMSTFNYLAYGNQHLTDENKHRFGMVSPADLMGSGLSAYDVYADGTGIRYSSRRRPLHNVRPEFVNPGRDDGFRNFVGDLMVMEWLQTEQHDFDVLTDDVLHAEASSVFDAYDVLIFGSHPEYWSLEMMKALKRFLSNGGRMLYLGGNGFYWRTVVDPSDPARIEISRANAGTRLWESAPGEAHFLANDELGGLWRYLGYSPHELVGTGFSGMGWAPGSGYTLSELAPEWRWASDGVDAEFGWSGEILGTAAADEVDSMNPAFGTPADTVLIATAHLPLETYVSTPEDFLELPLELPPIQGHVVLRPYTNGGAVFAAGSIAWPGALSTDPNGVGRLTRNVLKHFLDVPRGHDLSTNT